LDKTLATTSCRHSPDEMQLSRNSSSEKTGVREVWGGKMEIGFRKKHRFHHQRMDNAIQKEKRGPPMEERGGLAGTSRKGNKRPETSIRTAGWTADLHGGGRKLQPVERRRKAKRKSPEERVQTLAQTRGTSPKTRAPRHAEGSSERGKGGETMYAEKVIKQKGNRQVTPRLRNERPEEENRSVIKVDC